MKNTIDDLDRRGYRKFGITTGAILAVLFGLIAPYILSFSYPRWPWIVAGILAGCALAVPMALKYPYRIWMGFGLVMNWINTRIILGLLFYGLFFPIGLLLKILGKDALRRKFDPDALSYREHKESESKHNLERPY
ncbi:SxtJ family membrane protein [Ferrigenium sp. UT5]|uniref:SxtJ family membrane protein n=1 Tax=Ferrigenium sp. UT5 TaxID=3242105 RepID=UPI0038B2E7EC